jgi:hypothetical protein
MMKNNDNSLQQFGFNNREPWALDALRLLFSVPRTYSPLLDAWETRFPGTKRAVDRLVAAKLVEYQPGVVIDTRNGKLSQKSSRPLPRYRTTAKGRRLYKNAELDGRVLSDAFRRITPEQIPKITKLLSVLNLEQPHVKYGLSAPHAIKLSELPERTGRWWIRKLVDEGLITELPKPLADVRELIPAHWRVTRDLCRQVSKAIVETGYPASLSVEFRLNRSRFLGPVDPARVGVSGATDFDHDIETQLVLAAVLRSNRCLPNGSFMVEPRIGLQANANVDPWEFTQNGSEVVFYQPDVELRERDEQTGGVRRMVIEYERFQSRRDAWSHIERFLGWLHLRSLPFEGATLRFIVDSEPRVRSYVTLIEAFADQAIDNQKRIPANSVVLAVTSADRLLAATDPLDPKVWFRIALPSGAETGKGRPVLHTGVSPYDDYFSRGGSTQDFEMRSDHE